MKEEDKHNKPKAYISLNTRFWKADKFKIIKYAEESIHAHLIWHTTEDNIHSLIFVKSKSHKNLLLLIYNYKWIICKNHK